MQMLVCLMLFQKSLKIFSFLKLIFFLSPWEISTTVFQMLIRYSVSSNLLLNPSTVFFINIEIIVFFSSDFYLNF